MTPIRSTPGRRHAALALLALCAVAAVSGAAATDGHRLVVTDAETGERYLTAPVENGTTAALSYTHSVERTPVVDEYTVRGDRLEMTRMTFESYGWGLPAGANVTRENGTFVYDPPGTYDRVTVAPGEIAGHELRVGDRTVDLVALSDGASVHIRVVDRTGIFVARPLTTAATPQLIDV